MRKNIIIALTLLFIVMKFIVADGEEIKLKNYKIVPVNSHIKVILIPQNGELLTSVQLWINGGLYLENYKCRGIFSLVANIIGKKLGNDFHKKITKDWVMFNSLTIPDMLEKKIKEIEKVIYDEKISKEELSNEKRILMAKSEIDSLKMDKILENMEFNTLFMNSPYRNNLYGNMDRIDTLNLDNIEKFLKEKFFDEITIIISGNLNIKKCESIIKKSFKNREDSSIKKGWNKKIYDSNLKLIRDRGIRLETRRMETSLSWWYPQDSDNFYISIIVAELLKYGKSSVNKELKDNLKLIYSSEISLENLSRAGVISIRTKLKFKNNYKVKENILRLITDLSLGKIDEKELSEIKSRIYSKFLFSLDNLEARTVLIGRSIVERKRGLLNFRKKINSINIENIKEFIYKYMSRDGYVYSYIIPYNKSIPKMKKKRRRR